MTNTARINHTDCSHDATPRGRAWCRKMRTDAIKTAQAAYLDLCTRDENTAAAFDNYYALVHDVSFRLGVELRDAYEIVENGPLV